MKTRAPGDVLLFNGQGSKEHLSDPETVAKLEEQLGEANSLFKVFLQQCFDAFHSECSHLNEKERSVLGCDSSKFYRNTNALFSPPEAIRSHPVTETISLYLRQILELVTYAVGNETHPRVVEVTGICTGLIPAVLAASTLSYESPGFLDLALHGFRLSFWIGLRSACACQDLLRDRALNSAWVLSTFGWPTKQLETALTEFGNQEHQELYRRVQISAIFDNDVHSLSGPGPALAEFRSAMIPSSIQCRTAHVHGLYHGGARMNGLVGLVMHDVETRLINFPTWDTLHAPLRSPTTGECMMQGDGCQSLLETVLRSIFVEVCDWKTTRERLFDRAIKCLSHDIESGYRVLCIGPGSRSLLQGAPTHKRLKIVTTPLDLAQDNIEDMIAIVGMSINYPEANCMEQLWDVLKKARCTASKIPPSRFDVSEKLNSRLGNFLEDPFQFDSSFFNISPREAKSMDPQHRLLLQAAFEALEDSGYQADSTPSFQKESFGVFVGVATNDYVDNLRQDIDVYYSPGTLRAFLSGRISYAFQFLGPSIVVDTACSSSIVALYQACQALRSGECTVALAGGVNIISSPDMYNGLARAHFLSPTGQCRPFDAAADGYCRAEGCGLVVVKKLLNAIKENDHIYGVIRGIGVNQCGIAKSITHPDHRTQAALFARLLSSSRTAPDTISVVEAHGTGTQAGDYAEILSISSTFGSRSESNPLYVSSIKGNIGHAEAASGMAGVAKLLAMFRSGKIPPQASFKSLNPRLKDHIHNIVVPNRLTEWARPTNHPPRRAMLCNFGAAGSNSALVLEEYVPKSNTSSGEEPVSSRSYHVMNLSARSKKALQLLRDKFIAYIGDNPEIDLNDLCYTSNARRQAHTGFRLSATGANSSQLTHSLLQSRPSQPELTSKRLRKSIFLFSGQGHARKGMGAELLSTIPEFGSTVGHCDEILSQNGFPTVSPYLFGSANPNTEEYVGNEIGVAQCALFVLEFALARVWSQWGLLPDIVIGHSIGEYAALAIAGMLDIRDALLLIARRAELIATKCVQGTSGMVTCRTTVDDIRRLLQSSDSRFLGLDIACINSREDVVLSGPIESIRYLIEHCKVNGIKAKQLDVSYGFHSSCMDPILSDFEASISTVRLRKPGVIVGSSLHGRLLDSDKVLQPDYFLRHTRDSVDFCHVIEDVESAFPDAELDFIEVGPSSSCESMIRRIIKNAPFTFLPSLRPTESSWETLSQDLSCLFLRNHPIKWREIYDGSSPKFLTSLPKYPWDTSRYFVPFQEQSINTSTPGGQPKKPTFKFIGSANPTTSQSITSFQTQLAPLAPYIKAHIVAGIPLCPASVLIEVVLEALSMSQGMSGTSLHLLEDVVFERPLVYADTTANEITLETDLDTKTSKNTQFLLSSGRQQHSSGLVGTRSSSEVVDVLTRKSSFVKRQRRTLYQDSGGNFDVFSSKTIYEVIFPRVVVYDQPFRTLKQLSVSESRLEACGTVNIDSSLLQDGFVCHPAFLDTLLHAPGFVANVYVPADIACICVGIERAYLPNTMQLKEGEMTVYCSLADVGHSLIADGYMVDSEDKVVSFIEGCCFKKILRTSFNNHLSRTLGASVDKPTIKVPTTEMDRTGYREAEEVALPPTPPNDIGDYAPMKNIFLDICGIQIDSGMVDAPLVTLGVDSLLSIEINNELRDRFGFSIEESRYDISELTFNQLQEMLMSKFNMPHHVPTQPEPQTRASVARSRTVTLAANEDYGFQKPLQKQSHGPHKYDVFLFHDGSGHCNFYSRMSGMNRNITGIFSPEPSAEIKSLEDLASFYVNRIKFDDRRGFILGGWSFGGVLAFEVARQLRSLGQSAKGLILIDSPPPVDHIALPLEVISYVLDNKPVGETPYTNESSNQARRKVKHRFEYHAMLLQNYHPEPCAENTPCVMLKCSRSMDTEALCNVTYPWISDDAFREASVSQWEGLIGESIPVLDIACNHFQVFDADYVGDVSEKVILACEMLEDIGTPLC